MSPPFEVRVLKRRLAFGSANSGLPDSVASRSQVHRAKQHLHALFRMCQRGSNYVHMSKWNRPQEEKGGSTGAVYLDMQYDAPSHKVSELVRSQVHRSSLV